MANAEHSRRIYPVFAHISGNVRPIAALWKIRGLDQIQAVLGELNAPVDGRARAALLNFALEATICMKKQGLRWNSRDLPKTYAIDKKLVICWSRIGG
jgi:hypothetical protein